MIEYLTDPDEVNKEDPLPITHEVVCYHLYSNLHLTLFCNNYRGYKKKLSDS